jgi:hypothetical protein
MEIDNMISLSQIATALLVIATFVALYTTGLIPLKKSKRTKK